MQNDLIRSYLMRLVSPLLRVRYDSLLDGIAGLLAFAPPIGLAESRCWRLHLQASWDTWKSDQWSLLTRWPLLAASLVS